MTAKKNLNKEAFMAEYRQLLAAYEKVFEISGAEASDHLELEVIGDMGLDCRAARYKQGLDSRA
ncbi:hypothetical protein MVEG_12045 [Podila verticillata NRRL 6337]|uniref:Uncharacterized protein n=1 Tax=Podila verticillata NRRL 6337 TaxID=1069443 RepID=A0A086TL26_9FUNG|nr:hypothetical protein MVEG_12045 [Podila verticillata NRRL 6337]